jgi:hypothetical protein
VRFASVKAAAFLFDPLVIDILAFTANQMDQFAGV